MRKCIVSLILILLIVGIGWELIGVIPLNFIEENQDSDNYKSNGCYLFNNICRNKLSAHYPDNNGDYGGQSKSEHGGNKEG